ncbi:MAG TPA: hypothetical protein VI895_02090, partial [Bdellovibrionota bacterium]|nr:hypothetical protein [Bdellovibrionota bacterium]
PAATRVIYGPNALPNRPKEVRLTVMDLGFWEVDYAPNENISVGVQLIPPFGVFGGGPVLRAVTPIADKLHAGVTAQLGGFSVIASNNDHSLLYYGGGPIITYGDARYSLNVSVLTYGAQFNNKSHVGLFPTLGASAQISEHAKFNLEAISMNKLHGESSFGKVWAILYSLRFFSDGGWFGEVGFIAPIFPGAGDFYSVAPLGIPLLSFGKAF